MIKIRNLKFEPLYTENDIYEKLSSAFGVAKEKISEPKLVLDSIDARGGKIHKICSFAVSITSNEEKAASFARKKGYDITYPYKKETHIPPILQKNIKYRPIVVGFGPAGMFASYVLAEAGAKPVIIERGHSMEQRAKAVEAFNKTGILDTESNIQFGEGGAGAFSDGKLTTLIKDRSSILSYITEIFVKHGAPESILYEAHPHIGTDKLRSVIVNIREYIKSLGGEFRFDTKMTSLVIDGDEICGIECENNKNKYIIDTDSVFLCLGHSSRDTFRTLSKQGLVMERKPFSVGVRIEHKRKDIDSARFHEFAEKLPAADYKLSAKCKNGRILYTFCMCPGGNVVAATDGKNKVVTNGMSYHARNGENSNSALLVSVMPEDIGENLFSGVEFQEKLEESAFIYGGGGFKAPCQTVGSFINNEKSSYFGDVSPSYPLGVTSSVFDEFLPSFLCETLREGIKSMGNELHGFDNHDAVLTAVESRSTCPIRILRNENLMSSVKGLYPVGEGAGYAGGIMSAAADGIKSAEKYISEENK